MSGSPMDDFWNSCVRKGGQFLSTNGNDANHLVAMSIMKEHQIEHILLGFQVAISQGSQPYNYLFLNLFQEEILIQKEATMRSVRPWIWNLNILFLSLHFLISTFKSWTKTV